MDRQDRGRPEEKVPGTVFVALAVPIRNGRILVARRGQGSHLEGLWEFPGGRIEREEEPAAAARRELLEEAGLAGGEIEPLLVHVFDYPDRRVNLHVYLMLEPQGDVRVDGGREWAWVACGDLASLPMPEANEPILRALCWRLGS